MNAVANVLAKQIFVKYLNHLEKQLKHYFLRTFSVYDIKRAFETMDVFSPK